MIKAIYPQGGSKDVWIQQQNYNGSGCSGPNGQYFLLPSNHENHAAIYAMLLSAYLAERPVNLYLKTGVCAMSTNLSEISLAIIGTLN